MIYLVSILDYSPKEGKVTASLVSEDELRIYPKRRGIKPASRYLKSIDILVLESEKERLLPDLLFLQKATKTPIRCYETIDNFYSGRNGIPLNKFLKSIESNIAPSNVPLREYDPSFRYARTLIDSIVPLIRSEQSYKVKASDVRELDINGTNQYKAALVISTYLRRAEQSGYRLRKNDLELERMIRDSRMHPIDFIEANLR